MRGLLILVFLGATVISASVSASGIKELRRNATISWPETGLEVCRSLVDKRTRTSCEECFNSSANDLTEIRSCVRDWLPLPFARCSRKPSADAFNFCVFLRYMKSSRYNRKANVFYEKSDKYLKKIADYSYLENGPPALFSSFAQGILFNTKKMKTVLQNSKDCRERYSSSSEQERNEVQESILTNNLQTREMDYQYGQVGHDMPFKGVGPLALSALSGMCDTIFLEGQQKLQVLVKTALKLDLPIPAWVFQELVKNVNSLQI